MIFDIPISRFGNTAFLTQDFGSSKFAHVFSQKIFKKFLVNIANNHFKKAEALFFYNYFLKN